MDFLSSSHILVVLSDINAGYYILRCNRSYVNEIKTTLVYFKPSASVPASIMLLHTSSIEDRASKQFLFLLSQENASVV